MGDAIELESHETHPKRAIDIALTGEVHDDVEDLYKGHP